MAWTAPKTWTAGERLFASDLNTYVSDNLADLDPRTVKTFADASARTSGIPSPTEGMLSYLADTDEVEVYDGSAWNPISQTIAGIGSNVVQTVKTDTFTTTNLTWTDITGLSVTITPTSATSKILVIAELAYTSSEGTFDVAHWRIVKGGSPIFVGDAASNRLQGAGGTGRYGTNWAAGAKAFRENATFLDSPATTSAVTYGIQIIGGDTATTSIVNRQNNDADNSGSVRTASSITAIEVAA